MNIWSAVYAVLAVVAIVVRADPALVVGCLILAKLERMEQSRLTITMSRPEEPSE